MPTTYTLASNPGGRFQIVGNMLQTSISLVGQAGSYPITVRAANSGGFIERNFSVTIDAAGNIDRIDQITTSPQGRQNVVPFSFYEDGQNEMVNPNEHPHVHGFTHTSVRSGNFSDPTIWNTGTVPGAGSVWRIASPHVVTYDLERDVIMKDGSVSMGATLKWATSGDTRMRIDFLMVMGSLDMRDPTESATLGKAKHEVVFHQQQAPLATTRLGLMSMGPARILGAKKKSYLRIGLTGAQTAPAVLAGASTIKLTGLEASAWRVGDVLHILGTEYVLPATTDPQYTGPTQYFSPTLNQQRTMNHYQFGQDEERTIIAISGDTVTLNAPLAFDHIGITGTLFDGKVVTMAPVVANMSRSILFRTASAAEDGGLDAGADLTDLQKRAHIMFMRHPDVDTRYFALKNMGRSSNDPSMFVPDLPFMTGSGEATPLRETNGGTLLANPINVTGRWALHYHWCGGPYAASPQINCIGAVVYAPIGEVPTPGWGIVQHGTRMAIEDCNVSNFRGAGIVAEQGGEIGQWVNNCVTGGRGDGDQNRFNGRSEYYAKHHGAIGIAYDLQSRSVLLHDNIAGSCHVAFEWHNQKVKQEKKSPRDIDMRLVDGITQVNLSAAPDDTDVYGNVNAQIPPMINNEVWASNVGFRVIHRQGRARIIDQTPLLMEGYWCCNVTTPWNVTEYSNSYYIKDGLWQGPANRTTSSVGGNLGNVSWEWNFSNIHLRRFNTAFADGGAGLNYHGHLMDITTENVNNFTNISYRTVDGAHPTRDVMGPWEVNPANPTQWRIRVYQNEPSSSFPLPYPLEPYGRKLPAGYPPVPVGGTPYFVLGDGVNGEASPGLNLTLTAGRGRNQGALYGIIRDCVGDKRYPDWQSSESFPSQIGVRGAKTFEKAQPEQAVQRNGCWFDGTNWKMRTHHFAADRYSHARLVFHVDWTLVGFNAAFLAAHDIGGPPVAPVWPDKLEKVPAVQPDLVPVSRTITFYSRTTLQVVEGQPLTHMLRPNDAHPMLSIVGGPDAAAFRISNMQLQWAAGGTRALDGSDANGDNVYEVTVRAMDVYGNMVDQPHQVRVVASARVSAAITDSFDRANENLTANPAYQLLAGPTDGLRIVGNRLESFNNNTASPTVVSLGSLGTSDQELSFSFPLAERCRVLLRMVDANNWLSLSRIDGGDNCIRLDMCVAGVITNLARFQNGGGAQWVAKLRDRRFEIMLPNGNADGNIRNYPLTYDGAQPLEYSPFTSPGVIQLPANAPTGVEVGVSTRGSLGVCLDNFSAKPLV